jgi:hypothetical protein
VHAEQIRQWCGNPDAQITVQPVIDLNEHIDVEAYEIRGRLRDQTVLTHPTCVFPWCTRPARALEPDEHDADCDHRVPGGFNWSSQHLDRGGVHGQTSWVDAGVDGQSADEVAGHAVAAA